MCQLFALNSNARCAVTFSFTALSARGGHTGDHVDGFGLAFHDGRDCRSFIDEGRASDAPLADFLRQHPIHGRTVLAHVRKATQGPVRLANCHPFVREWQGRPWSFCHNGHLQGFRPHLSGRFLPTGDTDSEWAFCWLLQQLQRRFRTRRRPAWPHLAPALAELVARIARHGRFNFVMSDGEALYAHASTRLHLLTRQHPFATAQLVDHDVSLDLAGANQPGDRMVLLATEPLTHNEDWQALEPGEMLVAVAGQVVWRSTPATAASPWRAEREGQPARQRLVRPESHPVP